jgi:hypothetical protein
MLHAQVVPSFSDVAPVLKFLLSQVRPAHACVRACTLHMLPYGHT